MLSDLLARMDAGRISVAGVRKEVARVLGGPLEKARLHGAFTEDDA